MRQVLFRKQARLEFDEAGDWYEKERTGLGPEFLAEIHQLLQRIASNPEQFPILHRDVRKAVTKRFPYCTIFVSATTRSLFWPCFTAHAIRRYGEEGDNWAQCHNLSPICRSA
jgi:hypothetical protein